MTRRGKILVPLLVLAALGAIWFVQQTRYARQISPDGIRTISDHFARFGPPASIRIVHGPVHHCYEFYSFANWAPPFPVFPSCPPAYIYDQKGNFVAWCSDPGEQSRHWKTWRYDSDPLDIQAIRQQFAPTVDTGVKHEK